MQALFLLWNSGLAIFSALGSFFTIPDMVNYIQERGISELLCNDPFQTVGKGSWALWSVLFVCSKYIELVDTAFVVLREKPITLLHSYHHASVLLFVWRAFIVKLSSGILFTSMNFLVHTLMYSYYAQAALRHTRPRWGLVVTLAQLLQMVVGMTMTIWHTYLYVYHHDCNSDPTTLCVGMIIYVSYFCLFLQFAAQRYVHYIPTSKPYKNE